MKSAILCLLNNDLYETTIELISDVLTNYSKFLTEADFCLLQSTFNSPWAHEKYDRLIKGDFDFDSLQFGMFMIAFGDATVQDLMEDLETDPQCSQYLSALCGLLGAEGLAVHEDKIYVPALEFWNTFVEAMVDEAYQIEGKLPWFTAAQGHIVRVIEKCFRKSQFPPASVYNSWDSVDRIGFKDARKDFIDMLQQFYLTTGIPLLQFFIDLIQKAVDTRNWTEFEVATYCLAAFNDCTFGDSQRNGYLDKVFTTSLLNLVSDLGNGIPTRAMKAFLDLIIAYADFFQHRPSILPGILNIVFQTTGQPALAKTAARSIMKLCSDCRYILLPELGAFMLQCGRIFSSNSLDVSVKEAVMEGISSIIQAIEVEESKLGPLNQLLDYIESDVRQCIQFTVEQTQLDMEGPLIDTMATDMALMVLKCLEGIAKGIRVPDDAVVDLEKRDHEHSPFWVSGEGSYIQQRIYSIMCRVYDSFGNRGDIVDVTCQIWRHGFREMEPGPFVMPPEMAATFLMKANVQTPRLGRVIQTACFLVTSRRWNDGPDVVLDALLTWVAQLLHSVGGKYCGRHQQ